MNSWNLNELVIPRMLGCQIPQKTTHPFAIKRAIFNAPATIVFWEDGTKTVVKCGADDTFDEEKGLALCFMKKACNNKPAYNNILKRYCHV